MLVLVHSNSGWNGMTIAVALVVVVGIDWEYGDDGHIRIVGFVNRLDV